MTDAAAFDRTNPPHLIVLAGGQASRELPLLDEVTIGRAEDNSLVLLDAKVSRHHACISSQGDRFVVADLGSANGTLVDGVPIAAPHPLVHGERILIGDVEMVYHEPGRPGATTLVTARPALSGGAAARRTQRPLRPPETARREGRGPVIGLILAAVVLAGAVLLVGAYFLLPGLFGRGAATPTQAAGLTAPAAASPGAAQATPGATATAAPTPLPGPTLVAELNDELDDARVLALRSKFEDAVAGYEKMAARAPRDPRPEIGWAWALIYDDRPDEALAHAQKAAALAVADPDAAAVLARALVDLGRKDEALAVAQRAVELGPASAAAHTALAEALRLNERYPEAADHAGLALVQDINNADAHRARAWLYDLIDQDMGRAISELHIAAGLQTQLWVRRHELGEMLLQAEDYTTAIIAFQDALALRPKAVTYTRIGEAYYALGQFDPARISLLQAVQAGAKDARTYALLASSDAKLGRCDHARPYVNDTLALEPSNELALEAQAACQAGAPAPSATPVAAVTPTPVPTLKPTRTTLAAPLSGRLAFPVYNSQTGQYDVYVAHADGSGRRRVLEGVDQPAFSPDGKWLAVRGARSDLQNLFVLRADGSSLKQVSRNIEDKLPYWSPDGGRIVFASTKDQPGHPKALYVIDPVPLEGAQIVDGRRVETGHGPVQGEQPSWMADGRLVYKGCNYFAQPMSCGLFVIGAGGGQFTQLTSSEHDAAPVGAGGQVAFMSNRDGNWEIYVVRDDGAGLKRLTNNASDDGLPTWSANGKILLFVSNQGGAWAVWAMNPDGSGRQKLFDLGGGLDASWTEQRLSWAP